MNFVPINATNLDHIDAFLHDLKSPHFRYYNTRSTNVILKNHVYTVVGILEGKVIAYGHIDFESKYWLGIAVLGPWSGQGYGTQMMAHLLDMAKVKGLPQLDLSVDEDNASAIHLYQKFGFVLHTKSAGVCYMTKVVGSSSSGGVIELPVSFGEALDKLSILEIKLEKIADDRRKDVCVEYELLKEKLDCLFTPQSHYHYTILKHINLAIWDMQDVFRVSADAEEKVKLAMQIIDDNDRRFRVKAKLNTLFNSHLKEQKGYARKKAFVDIEPTAEKFYETVRYLSTAFDQVILRCNPSDFFADDPTIVHMDAPDDAVKFESCLEGLPEYFVKRV